MRRLTWMLTWLLAVATVSSCAAKPDSLTEAELDQRARNFVGYLASGKFEEAVAMMDRVMSGAMPAAKLQETWQAVQAQLGSYNSFISTRFAVESSYKVVYVTCRFGGALVDVKVVFNSSGKVAGLWFVPAKSTSQDYVPPAYADPSKFVERDCFIGRADFQLPATLTLPVGQGPFPAVVLVHGSGPQDRDETVGPNKPFKDLAWGLATRGIAVLRYEKRTKQYPDVLARQLDGFTVYQETIEDVLYAVSYLKGIKEIDPSKVFVVGHSLGAYLGPRIVLQAEQSSAGAVAGLVMMAPPARSILDLMVVQMEYLSLIDGRVDDQEFTQLQKVKDDVARIKQGAIKQGEIVLGAPKSYWTDLLSYDAISKARDLSIPILILQGLRDYQVTKDDFDAWKEALRGADNVKMAGFADLNHLFMAGSGKSVPSEYYHPGHVDQSVIETIADWVGVVSRDSDFVTSFGR